MNLFALNELTKNKRELVEKLKSWKVIPEEPNYLCSKCGGSLTIGKNEKYQDCYMWVCRNNIFKSTKRMRCGNQLSLRTGTFFESSRLSMLQILGFVHMWVHDVPTKYIMDVVEISTHAAADWSSYCREVLYYAFVRKQERLGGEGIVVQVQESKFGQTKYNRSRTVDEQFIFAGYECGTGRVFIVTVKDRSSKTLVPVIRKWICPGTTIMTDSWQPIDSLEKEGYKHVNFHCSGHFVKPENNKNEIPGNLAKYIFQKRCRQLKTDPFTEFLKLAGEVFNPMNPQTDSRPVFGQCQPDDDDIEVRVKEENDCETF